MDLHSFTSSRKDQLGVLKAHVNYLKRV